jgi:AcrR family transcriptional regulator
MITQRENTVVRQKQIVDAARRLIIKQGSEHVTVRKMAKEIGVTEGAIYRHFKSKSDVLSFLVDDIEKTLIADIDNNYTGKLNSLETLKEIIRDHISAVEQRKGISFQVIAEIVSLGDKKLNKKIRRVIDEYIARIKEILAEGIKQGIVQEDIDLDSVAMMFFSMTQGLVNIWALSQYDFNLQQRYKLLWEVFVKVVTPSER